VSTGTGPRSVPAAARRQAAPSHPEPPAAADLAVYGHAACLAALREEFEGLHRRWPQYRGWTEGTCLGVVRYRIGGGSTFVRAEPGDLVLVKRESRAGLVSGLHWSDVAYVPRAGWNVGIGPGAVEDITAGQS
jgi:hypothetical protein